MLTLLLMLPLALTSFNAAIRALGGRRWQMLHKLAYFAALSGLLHFYWKKSAKNDVTEVMVYAVILAVLLGWRAMRAWQRRRAATASPAAARPQRVP